MSLDEDCPSCGTAMTYQLGENNFMCKCTYELELEIEPSKDEIVSMVKQVRKEMAEERAKEEVITLCECDCMKSGEIRERERIIKILIDYAPHLTTEGLMQQIKGEQ